MQHTTQQQVMLMQQAFHTALIENGFTFYTVYTDDDTYTATYNGCKLVIASNGLHYPITEVMVQCYTANNEILQVWATYTAEEFVFNDASVADAIGKLLNSKLVFTEFDMQDVRCMNLEVPIQQ